MAKRDEPGVKDERPEDRWDEDGNPLPTGSRRNYDVGYGRPPIHSQFQKGQSGNPGGRPKRDERVKPRTIDDILAERLAHPRQVRVGDQVQTLPAAELVVESLIQGAMKNHKAAKDLLDHARRNNLTFGERPQTVQELYEELDKELSEEILPLIEQIKHEHGPYLQPQNRLAEASAPGPHREGDDDGVKF